MAVPVLIRMMRLPNLVLIALTMYLVRGCLLNVPFTLNEIDFFLLTLSLVLLAAAGYLINDYYDCVADRINKPQQQWVGTAISKGMVLRWYWIFNAGAVILGFYAAYLIGNIVCGILQPVTALLLWFYSFVFKRTFLIGNGIVAAITTLPTVTVAWFEPRVIASINGLSGSLRCILFYSFFAFVTNLIRELIKDIEDIKGDEAMGCKTLPVVWGIQKATNILLGLCMVLVFLLGCIQGRYMSLTSFPFWYFTVAIQLPLILLLYVLFKARDSSDFYRASRMCKLLMLAGVLSMLLPQWIQAFGGFTGQ
ncbi:MAG TPA: geranylgeranylglycerol-phosphate geranylgeranyltransferase [Bacteroidia bacterium]|jgi:4-hydroxybenzoate polyprenyltransferase|nr:geranylgeranylglycerol-phosphate geranylgeranyltransferase [Bacteroidia bacterium]